MGGEGILDCLLIFLVEGGSEPCLREIGLNRVILAFRLNFEEPYGESTVFTSCYLFLDFPSEISGYFLTESKYMLYEGFISSFHSLKREGQSTNSRFFSFF